MLDRAVTHNGSGENAESREERMAQLLGECIDELNVGGTVDRDRIWSRYPDIAEDVFRELDVLQTGSKEECYEVKPVENLGRLGDYRLLRQLGRGGMGVVYEAWEGSMERPVALKVLPGGLLTDLKAVARFQREAKVAGRLQHPNIVSVYGTGVDENTPYYSMELVQGETLSQLLGRLRAAEENGERRKGLLQSVSHLLKRNGVREEACELDTESPQELAGTAQATRVEGPLDVEEVDLQYCLNVARAFAGVAEGLQHAHSKGIIHRDIKPSNLMLDREGRLRIVDFGLAHLEGQESLTVSGDFVGTPLYMSPEQATARKIAIDHRTDIYSLGASMYELLAWRPPFKGRDHQDTLSQIIERDPQPLRKRNPRIPKDVETIVLKCLRKDPGDRYGTAEALAQDLRRYVRGDPIEAQPQSALEKLSRRLRVHRWRITVAASVCVLSIFTALLGYSHFRSRKQQDWAEYRERVRSAARILQRDTFLVTQDLGNLDIISADVASDAKYCFPTYFARFGKEPLENLLESLNDVIRRLPHRAEGHYYRAKALRLLNRYDEAIAALQRAHEGDPDFVPAAHLLRELSDGQQDGEGVGPAYLRRYVEGTWQYEWLRAQRALKAWRWEDAAEAFEKVEEHRADGEELYLGEETESLLGRGKAYLGAKRLLEAAETFSAAQYLWPHELEPTLFLAKAYYLKGEYADVERIFGHLYSRKPPVDAAAVLIASMYHSFRDHERALLWNERIPDRDACIRVCSKSSILLSSGKVRQAEAEARSALAHDPESAWAHGALGRALAAQMRQSEAEEAFKKSIDLDPRYVPGFVGLGMALCRQGQWERGIRELKRAIASDPDSIFVYYDYVEVLLWREDLEQAESLLLQALQRNGGLPHLHSALGFVYWKMGLCEKALSELNESIRLDPLLVGSYYYLALLRTDLNQLDKAIRRYAQALELDPSRSYCHRDLLGLLAREERLTCTKELRALVQVVEEKTASMKGHPLATLANEVLVLARLHLGSEEDVKRAVEVARRVVEERETQGTADALALLGRALFRNGEKAEAVHVLEEAARLPFEARSRSSSACRFLEDRLARCRTEVLPILPTYESVEVALASGDTEEIVPDDAAWRFFPGTREPSQPLAWIQADFDDTSWEEGVAGFGYWQGDEGTRLSDMRCNYSTVYLRHTFTERDPSRFTKLRLRLYVDDGCVVYLNGQEVARIRVDRQLPWLPFDAVALWWAEEPLVPVEVELKPQLLDTGKNVLAIQGLNLTLCDWEFLLIPSLLGELPIDHRRDQALLERCRSEAKHQAAGRLAYLEGMILGREGKHEQAAERFREVTLQEETEPEPYLRLAETFISVGDPEGAEDILRRALGKELRRTKELWDFWTIVCFKHLDLTPEETLTSFPFPEGTADPHGEDFRWLLGKLTAHDVVRINCGYEHDYVSADGRAWSRDRFFREGRVFPSRPYGNEKQSHCGLSEEDRALCQDLALYATNRYARQPLGGPVYSIPLPPAEYRVTLHFAEFVHGILIDGQRAFDVLVEEKQVLAEYRPELKKQEIHAVNTRVDDGRLDIKYVQGSSSFPMISGIEIERLD